MNKKRIFLVNDAAKLHKKWEYTHGIRIFFSEKAQKTKKTRQRKQRRCHSGNFNGFSLILENDTKVCFFL
jgi:hypothetical protein